MLSCTAADHFGGSTASRQAAQHTCGGGGWGEVAARAGASAGAAAAVGRKRRAGGAAPVTRARGPRPRRVQRRLAVSPCPQQRRRLSGAFRDASGSALAMCRAASASSGAPSGAPAAPASSSISSAGRVARCRASRTHASGRRSGSKLGSTRHAPTRCFVPLVRMTLHPWSGGHHSGIGALDPKRGVGGSVFACAHDPPRVCALHTRGVRRSPCPNSGGTATSAWAAPQQQ